MFLVLLLTFAFARYPKCYFPDGKIYEDLGPGPQSWEKYREEDLPDSLDWRNKDGEINIFLNGSCWDFGSVSAITDRFNIATKRFDNYLSTQYILACSGAGGCGGGSDGPVYLHARTHGIPHETCNNYKALDEGCNDTTRCSTCDATGCHPVKDFRHYKLKHFGTCGGYHRMKSELMSGPITCGIDANDNVHNYTGGIFEKCEAIPMIDHVISIVGWGVDEENGKEYWIMRNSWGTYWGEDGYMRIITSRSRPTEVLGCNGIERECRFGTPEVAGHEVWKWPRPEPTFTRQKDVPDAWDWRKENNYVNPIRNMNNPRYCPVSHIFAFTSSFAARLTIMNKGMFPSEYMSPEYALACSGSGTCAGTDGDMDKLIEHATHTGIPDETCNNWKAIDEECSDFNQCQDCMGFDDCYPAKLEYGDKIKYFKLKSSQNCSGIEPMKSAIFTNGPIICKLFNSPGFKSYSGGIYSEANTKKKLNESPDYWVTVLGWGSEGGQDYWIGRNHIGVNWGEDGWFRITQGKGNLDIDTDCIAVTPAGIP